MLKLTIREQQDRVLLRLEGKLIGPWTSLVGQCWQDVAVSTDKLVVVDLNAVTFIDRSGKALLAEMHDHGTILQARGPMTTYILEQIRASSMFAATGLEN